MAAAVSTGEDLTAVVTIETGKCQSSQSLPNAIGNLPALPGKFPEFS